MMIFLAASKATPSPIFQYQIKTRPYCIETDVNTYIALPETLSITYRTAPIPESAQKKKEVSTRYVNKGVFYWA